MLFTEENSFIDMPNHAKTWVFQSDRIFNFDEEKFILENGKDFTSQWTSHNQKMNARIFVLYHQFLVVSLDESISSASGCGIDKLTAFVKKCGAELKVDFFNRLKVAFWIDENVKLINYADIQDNLLKGIINNDTLTFQNHTVLNLSSLRNQWKQPLKNSWLSDLIIKPQAI